MTKAKPVDEKVQEAVTKFSEMAVELPQELPPIETEEQYKKACEFLFTMRAKAKEIEQFRVFITKPLNGHIREINAKFKSAQEPWLEKAEMADKLVVGWSKFQEAEALKLAASTKKEDPHALVELPKKTTITPSGKVTISKRWKHKIVDATKVEAKYWIINTAAIQADVNAGHRTISGVEVYQESNTQCR